MSELLRRDVFISASMAKKLRIIDVISEEGELPDSLYTTVHSPIPSPSVSTSPPWTSFRRDFLRSQKPAMDLNGSAMELDAEENYGTCLTSFVDKGTVESHKYYLARKTILEMLKDRGFAIPNSEIDSTLDEFREKYGQSPDIERLRTSAMHRNDLTNKVLVIFCGPIAVKVNVIRSIATQITNKESLSRLILVIQNQMTNQAMKSVELLSFKVEIFQITDLLVNITKHILKPKHEVLTKEEKDKLLKKYNLEEKQLPWMSQKEAIGRYYGLEKGQVLKVTYSSEIIETHVTYRCVW